MILNIYSQAEYVDGIVAVIGDEVILMSDLQRQMSSQMMRRNMNTNSPRNELIALREDTLQGMIDDLLLLEKARRDSIEINMRDVDTELNARISDFKTQLGSEDLYRQELNNYGITELQLRRMFHSMIVKDFLRETLRYRMLSVISVTPQELEQWIESHKDSIPDIPEKFKISHILLYPRVSEERLKDERKRAEAILEKARAGEDFADLAKEYSEDTGTAEKGGDLGYFRRDELLPDFTAAAFSLNKGEISDIVETVYGYHIIKVEDIRGEEIHARHILFQFSPDESDENEIVKKLTAIRSDILSGQENFEEMAKQYSEDDQSKDLGGALPWLPNEKGDIILSFKQEGQKLKPGEISEPFKSEYGYHIIRLDDYKAAHKLNLRDDRALIEPYIKNEKFIVDYNKIIASLREKTYIDISLK